MSGRAARVWCLLLLLPLSFRLPLRELPLSFLALEVSLDCREDAPGEGFNLVLGRSKGAMFKGFWCFGFHV